MLSRDEPQTRFKTTVFSTLFLETKTIPEKEESLVMRNVSRKAAS